MPQTLLPLILDGATQINDLVSVVREDDRWTYFHGAYPHYVSGQRLCLRGTTDYWVNDALGQPFFVVERPIDQGMRKTPESATVDEDESCDQPIRAYRLPLGCGECKCP